MKATIRETGWCRTILALAGVSIKRGGEFFLIRAILAAICLVIAPQGAAADSAYPDKGPVPTPMFGQTFRYQDPLSGADFNNDGTNSKNPVIAAGSQQQDGVTYLLKKLTHQSAITFMGKSYTVYSAVPQNMTIDYAYKNATEYYDPNSLVAPDGVTPIIDFTIPTTINDGKPTDLMLHQPPKTPIVSGYTKENVYLTKPPSDPNSLYFVPNLPNTAGGHDGLTDNIYFVGDPFLEKDGYWPDTSTWPNGTFHLTPYGWASDPRFVGRNYDVQLLDQSGGVGTDTVLLEPTPILRNFWKHTIKGSDLTYNTKPNDPDDYTVKRNILKAMFDAVKTDTNYPFPPNAEKLSWLKNEGVYFHVQPQPGFQRNLLRYYTAWGAVDIYNQASDLFVRPNGSIELPAVQDQAGKWRYAPIVTQTWDGSQRYTLLNLTDKQVPSTYDDYPGYEYYLAGNVYLPNSAGVVTAYVEYLVQDSTGLNHRETDLWLGFKGDTANDVLFWADAPVSTAGTESPTEPGGQANKPYMFGASTYTTNSVWNYSIRLQSSNSFFIARLTEGDLEDKLYDASFYANLNDGKGYQKAATISYKWQPWTLTATGSWDQSSDGYGAGVPQITFADTLNGKVSITAAKGQSFDLGTRVMSFEPQTAVDPSTLSQFQNMLGHKVWEYFATALTTDSNSKFLIVLNPRTDWLGGSGGSGDWGDADNWSTGQVPGVFHNVYLEQNDSVDRTVTYHYQPAPSDTPLSMLNLDASGTGTLTLKLDTAGGSAGELQAEMVIVGVAGQGNLNQTAGKVTVTDNLYLGYEKTANGTYTLEDGTLIAANSKVGVYGTGTFTQSGGTNTVSDTLTLAANSGSSGTYNLQGGTLNANTLIINNGGALHKTGGTLHYNKKNIVGGDFVGDHENTALLMGTGRFLGQLTNSGTVNPGTSIGTLNVIGSYINTTSGTYVVEIASPAAYDKISVTGVPGTATLAGTIAPTLLGGYHPRGNQVFPGVIMATGGITGTFTTIANQQISPTLFWQTSYHTTSVDLWVQRNYIHPGLGLNTNQAAVGTMLNGVSGVTTGDLDSVLNAIDYLPSAGAVREAYNQISPEKAAPLPDLGFAAAVLQQRSLARRITDLRFGGREMNFARGFPGSLNLFGSRGNGGIMLAYSGASLAGMIPAGQEAAPGKGWGVFLDPAVIMGSQGSSDNQTGYDYTLAGFTLGVDCRVRPNFLVGLATGYSHTSAFFRGSGGTVTNNTWPLTAYAAYLPEKGYAFASLGYALNLFDLERHISFGGLSRRAQSSTTGHQFNAYGEAGYDFKMKPVVVTPAVSLAYTSISVNSFTEKNAGALNLKVKAQNADSLQTGVGAKVAAPFKRGSVKVVPQAYAFYQHEFSNNSRGLDARLSQGSSTLAFTTDQPSRDFAVVGGNVTMFINQRVSAMVNYNAEVGREKSTVHSINAGLRWEF